MTAVGGEAAAGRPRWREIDGIVLLDKPTGIGSTPALQAVRRLLRAAKAGHAGTLDPMATGMLPLCFGQATKACGSLLGARKAYRARLALGSATDTGDADGRTIRTTAIPTLDRGQLGDVLAAFVGAHEQVPPMYSALKQGGQPLYKLARRGEEVARAPRPVTIHCMELVEAGVDWVEFDVTCSKGTYVRVLAEELAASLGSAGHLAALRRLWVEPFESAPMVPIATIEAWAAGQGPDSNPAGGRPGWLLPVDAAFEGLARVELNAVQSLHLRQGRLVPVAGLGGRAGDERLRAYDPAGLFLGLVSIATAGSIRVERLFVAGANGDAEETA